MEITSLDIFEELRFILELLIAEHLIAHCFTDAREQYRKRVLIGGFFLVVMSVMYGISYQYFQVDSLSYVLTNGINISWYIILTLCSMLSIYQCYQLTLADAMFLCSGAYCLQHIEYVMVNEVIVKGVAPAIAQAIVPYALLCVFTTVLVYRVFYQIFHNTLQQNKGQLFEDNRGNIGFTTMMFVIVFLATFICQAIFDFGAAFYQTRYLGAVVDFLICILLIWVQYGIFQIKNINQEKEIIEHLLYERKRQYELSRENIETINHKCHDLKHQIRALKQVDSGERNRYLDEIENSIDIYDSVIETGNEVVNTIISEKTLNCERRNIKLSYIVDASHLDFMSTLDIYALLGNALDNAIESVSKYQDEEKRVISLTIDAVGEFLSIQTNNYCENEIAIRDGLPVTTKRNKEYHGFGMKSMRHLAKKYGGSLMANVDHHVFTLQILLPMPKEFLRLYQDRETQA